MNRKNTKKAQPVWRTLLIGTGIALALDLAVQLLMSELAVSGTLPESAVFPIQIAAAGCAALIGGGYGACRTPWGTFAGAMLITALFAGFLMLSGFLMYDTLTLMGRGGILLIAIIIGGLLSAVLRGGIHRRKKKRHI